MKVLVVAGPTASGKSALGLALARELRGEIVNCDSVQVYRELWIGTAKVPEREREGIPHHLIDFVDPADNFTAGDFARLARRTIEEIASRERAPVLAGGTGFYLRSLFEGLFEGPQSDLALRRRLKEILARRGAPHLHRLLQRIDPSSAQRLAPADWSRTIRAIEVYFQTRQPLSAWHRGVKPIPWGGAKPMIFALAPDRQTLYERINKRTDEMFAAGWVDEVRALIASGVPTDAKAFQAHGYRRIIEFLQGQRTLASAVEQTKLDTRHYAKRQLTWWRHQAVVTWLEGFGDEPEIRDRALELSREWLRR